MIEGRILNGIALMDATPLVSVFLFSCAAPAHRRADLHRDWEKLQFDGRVYMRIVTYILSSLAIHRPVDVQRYVQASSLTSFWLHLLLP